VRRILLQTCTLDRAGIPDLGDLQWIQLEARSIIATSIHVAFDCWQDPPLAYPFAAIETHDAVLYCPLEPETDSASLAISLTILREGFRGLGEKMTRSALPTDR